MCRLFLLIGAVVAAFTTTYMLADDSPSNSPVEVAIRAQAAAFCKAFNRGDAKAVADFYTENCEFSNDLGITIRGRESMMKAYVEHFKVHPKDQIRIEVTSIRFPSKSMAIEEGSIESTATGMDLPNTSHYRAIHVNENGQWLIALTNEWGSREDKLADLNWLVGTWSASIKGKEFQISFSWNEMKNVIISKYSTKENGKVTSSGTQRIFADAASGGIKALTFDDSGEHGQAIWYRDGQRWVAEASGVSPSGTASSSVNLLTRINDRTILWRSVYRVVNGQQAADMVPIKLTKKD